MWLSLLLLVIGFLGLVWSAQKFVEAAAVTARHIGVSTLIIGLTVVSVGTSAPEIVVALLASFEGAPAIAVGNAIGSNIANIGLVLGVTALFVPLPFSTRVLRNELPMLILATLLTGFCLFNLMLGRIDGLLLISMLGFILYRMARASKKSGKLLEAVEEELHDLPEMGHLKTTFWLLLGLGVLLLSAHVIVVSAENIALLLGVPEMVVGLTVVAVGTSLPELAASFEAAIRGRTGLAIGNVVGSNILNILAVLVVPAVVHPLAISPTEFWRDFGVMFAFTALMALFAYGIGSKKEISRFEGGVLVIALAGYYWLLVIQQA